MLALLLLLAPVGISIWALLEVKRLRQQVNRIQQTLKQPELFDEPQTDAVQKNTVQTDTGQTRTSIASSSQSPALSTQRPNSETDQQSKHQTPKETLAALSMHHSSRQVTVELDETEQPSYLQFDLTPYLQRLISHFRRHWLVWVGAVALVLGVTYLLQVLSNYIEFTPLMRISAAFTGSSVVVLLGEKFHRKEKQYAEIGFAYVPATISAAGMTGLYCTVIFSYLIYNFLPPVISLLTMGVISVASLGLCLRLGPLMAILGLFGGFTAPLWFAGDPESYFALAGYINIIALAGLLLTSHVRKAWLYPLILLPYFIWLCLISFAIPANQMFLWSLAYIPLAIYCLLGVPLLGWQLSTRYHHCVSRRTYNIVLVSLGTALLSALVVHKIHTTGDIRYLVGHLFALAIAWLPSIHKERGHGRYLSFTVAGVLLALSVASKLPARDFSASFIIFTILISFSLLILRSFFQFIRRPRDRFLGWFTPLLPLVLCCIGWFIIDQSYPAFLGFWLVYVAVINLLLGYYAPHAKPIESRLYASIHVSIAVALWFMLDGNMLTLAIAFQVLLYTWHVSKERYVPEPWALKLIVSIALIRLTIVALVPALQTGIASQGGNLPIHIASLAIFCYAYLLLRQTGSPLLNWLEGSLVHLVAMTLFAQTHYWISTQLALPISQDLPLISVYTCQTLTLAAIYRYRAVTAGVLQLFYQRYADLLYLAALCLIIALNSFYSPLLRPTVDHTSLPVINWMATGWLIPGLLLLYIMHRKLLPNIINPQLIYGLAAILIGLWFILSIRHFWQPESLVLSNITGMAEQFSYSLAGLTIGALVTLYGLFGRQIRFVHLGLGLLIAVVVKVFFIDTALLSGFWRAGSFLGLGAALVGLGWLFQRITASRHGPKSS